MDPFIPWPTTAKKDAPVANIPVRRYMEAESELNP